MYSNNWNEIVNLYNEYKSVSEDKIQSLWETIFSEFFNYSKLKREIDTKRNIQIGSTERIIPDIILKQENNDLCIIELKQETLTCGSEQLISYLKQLKIDIGILICSSIYIYAYEYNKPDTQQSFVKIDFVKDSQDGIKFVELLNKNNFNKESIKQFIHNKIKSKENILNIKNKISKELIINLLKKHFENEYSQQEIENAINLIELNIIDKLTSAQNIDSNKKTILWKKTIQNNNNHTIGTQKLEKEEIMRICKQNNISINPNYFTYAHKNKTQNTYWANPNSNVLSTTWSLILIDQINKELHCFQIPANSISKNDLKWKNDIQIDLQIAYLDDMFMDKRSKIEFKKWYLKTIRY